MYQGAKDSDGRNVPESRVLSNQREAPHTPLRVHCVAVHFKCNAVQYIFSAMQLSECNMLYVHKYLHQGIVQLEGGSPLPTLPCTQSTFSVQYSAFSLEYNAFSVE